MCVCLALSCPCSSAECQQKRERAISFSMSTRHKPKGEGGGEGRENCFTSPKGTATTSGPSPGSSSTSSHWGPTTPASSGAAVAAEAAAAVGKHSGKCCAPVQPAGTLPSEGTRTRAAPGGRSTVVMAAASCQFYRKKLSLLRFLWAAARNAMMIM